MSDKQLDGPGGDALEFSGAKEFQTIEQPEIIRRDAREKVVQFAHVQRGGRGVRPLRLKRRGKERGGMILMVE